MHERAVRHRDARQEGMRLVLDCMADAAVVVDAQGVIRYANAAAAALFRKTPRELLGEPLGCPIVLNAAIESELSRPGRGSVPVEWHATDIPWEDQTAVLVSMRDLTDRRRADAAEAEMRVARQIQAQLLPHTELVLPGFDIAGASEPADAVGGDYYDYLPLGDDLVGLVVGDAAGHGVGAALLIAETRACLGALALSSSSPGEILTRANLVLNDAMPESYFVTLMMVVLDPRRRRLRFASAGHFPGYVMTSTGNVVAKFSSTQLPLGVLDDTVYDTSLEHKLHRRDILVLMTDGAVETMDSESSAFGVKRVLQIVRDHRDQPARVINQAIRRAVASHRGSLPAADDVTILVIKVE